MMINIRVTNEQGEVQKELQLGDGTHNIGRTPDNTIELRDMKVSRNHAQLVVQNGVCTVEDTGSTTGVFVNEEKIIERIELSTGDVINIGDMTLDISFEDFSGSKIESHQIGCLRLISGSGISNLVPLDKIEMVMGRVPECDIQVMEQMASRQHAKITIENGSYFIEDCNSSNGTFLNDIQITKQPLQNGDVVKICDHTYKFEIKDKQDVANIAPAPKIHATVPPAGHHKPGKEMMPSLHGDTQQERAPRRRQKEKKGGGGFVKVASLLVIIGIAAAGYTYKDEIMKMVNTQSAVVDTDKNNVDNTGNNQNNTDAITEELATAKKELAQQEQLLAKVMTQVDEQDGILNSLRQQIEEAENAPSGSNSVDMKKQEYLQLKEELSSKIKEYKTLLAKYKKMKSNGGQKPPVDNGSQNTNNGGNQSSNNDSNNMEKEKQRLAAIEKEKQRLAAIEKERLAVIEKQRLEDERKKKEQENKNGNGGEIALTADDIKRIKEIDALKKIRTDFTKIVTANKCGECHRNEKQVWEKTPHNTTFDLMSKRPRAKDIFSNLGEKGSIKRSDRCMSCHFTQEEDRGKPKATSGVSCESCHGEGKDWIYIHNDRNVPKPERRKNAMSKGMNNPEDIYLIAQNCYQCHSVPDEELVNKGGHQAGSDNFEFVRWSQGMVRHNFVRTNNAQNAETTKERLRIMFVTGAMLDLEYAIRGLANATQQGPYLTSMMKRVDTAYKRLVAVEQKAGGIKEINELLSLFKKLSLRPGNKQQLEMGASLITLKAQEFTSNHDGSKLASLDSVMPAKDTYKWTGTND